LEYKLELVVLPVSDIDRAKAFYADNAGFTVDVDFSNGPDFRIVQLTPPGSACSVTLMRNDAPGTVSGLHLVVSDIETARADLAGRGVDIGDFFHFGPAGQTAGLAPGRGDFETYLTFSDPDGNEWLIQEVPSRAE
jgi:catechol 2,3-dioxygenase-like lactoylglutathione lyase family enzyme